MGQIALLKVAVKNWKPLLGAFLILVIVIPLLNFSTVITVTATVPAINEEQMRLYVETSKEVGEGKSFINYKDAIAIDAVRYKQEFSNANKNNVKSLTERFLLEHREETNYNLSSYKFVVDILNDELGVNIDWRGVAMVDALLTSEQFGKSDVQIKDLARKFVRIDSIPYEEQETTIVKEQVITKVWKSSVNLPDWMCQVFGWGEWIDHIEYVDKEVTQTVIKYREGREALTYDKVLLDLGHNVDQIPPFFNNKDNIKEQMQKVVITYTTKSLDQVMTELGMTSEEKQRAKVYRDIGLNLLSGTSGQGGGSPFGGVGEVPSGSIAEFIDRVSPGAIETQKKYGVCASISISQAILESGWGQSGLTKKSNNLFGIKADSGWSGGFVEMETNEYTDSQSVYTVVAKFRAYSTWAESIDDHGKFLKFNSRYGENGLFNSIDYISQAYALKAAGYATDPNYPLQLIELVQTYGLYKYDK